jgi:hypothetical protein
MDCQAGRRHQDERGISLQANTEGYHKQTGELNTERLFIAVMRHCFVLRMLLNVSPKAPLYVMLVLSVYMM